ncbi:hypothetical protein VYU27_008991 [Nannochloropsis oceanica]
MLMQGRPVAMAPQSSSPSRTSQHVQPQPQHHLKHANDDDDCDAFATFSTRPITLAPIFPLIWAIEVEPTQLCRISSYLPSAPFPSSSSSSSSFSSSSSPSSSSHSSTTKITDSSNHAPSSSPLPLPSTLPLAGCIANRAKAHSSCLLGATYRMDDQSHLIPPSHQRHISRVFYVPNACGDIGWLAFSPELREALKKAKTSHLSASSASSSPSSSPSFCLKISAFPKTMELQIGEVFLTASASSGCRLEEGDLSPSASQATHILHVVHSPDWSPLFYFGLTQSHPSAISSSSLPPSRPPSFPSFAPPTFDKLHSSSLPPVSRAYYKMKEVWEEYLDEEGREGVRWKAERKGLDVGASPGGWTQYLSDKLFRVIAVDGAFLHPSLPPALPNVRHVMHRVQAEEAREVLKEEGPFHLVCVDVNLFPQVAADLVLQHVFPFMAHHSLLILTLKFPRIPTGPRLHKSLRDLERIWAEDPHIYCRASKEEGKEGGKERVMMRLLWLHANSPKERTVITWVHRR